MPCPACTALTVPGSSTSPVGLKRVRSRRLLPGERLYRCADCGQLWRTHESDLSVMVPARGTLEATGESRELAKRGKSPDEIERALQLETVPEAEQGKRVDLTSYHDDKKSLPPAKAARLRAITRAPDAVKDA